MYPTSQISLGWFVVNASIIGYNFSAVSIECMEGFTVDCLLREIAPINLTISGITIQNCNYPLLYVQGESFIIKDSILLNNTMASGGISLISVQSTNVVVENCSFIGNSGTIISVIETANGYTETYIVVIAFLQTIILEIRLGWAWKFPMKNQMGSLN